MFEKTLRKRAAETVERLESHRIAERRPIDDIEYHLTPEFLDPESVPDREFRSCSVGFTWDRRRETTPDDRRQASADVVRGTTNPDLAVGQNAWFQLRFSVPDSMVGHPVYLRFVACPRDGDDESRSPRVESLCFRDGAPWKAFDNGHDSLLLTDDADGGEPFDLLVEAGTTTLWGNLDVEEFVLQTAEIYAERPAVADLHRHVSVCTDLVEEFDEDSPNRGRLLDALGEASYRFPFDADSDAEIAEGASAALSILEDVERDLTSDLTGQRLTTVGHAHIDLAWLWPWSESVRKGGRTFSNVLRLMDDYPSVTFMQSQPHLYDWVRERYPEQFAEIRERIGEGRWHPEGALWVEPDINNAGAEALARQYLLGKRYFRREFDVDPKVTFIPDVFGYSAGLPGIARAADCPYFLTQKLSWNEFNEFPHTTFHWEGIDGSTVLSHFPPADTPNGKMTVDEVTRSVYDDAQNARTDDRVYLVGYGDGGGGPTREMIERGEVIDDIDALPDVEWGRLADLFDRLADHGEDFPTWTGELYFEKHRGTLTTQARTKRNNRKGEYELREAETWSALARAISTVDYPYEDLTRAWKVLLFNQFHDILPGSSVADVYADADRDYEEVFETASQVRDDALATLVGDGSESTRICLTNPLSWAQRPTTAVSQDDVSIDGLDEVGDNGSGTPSNEGPALVAVPDEVTDEESDVRAVQRTEGLLDEQSWVADGRRGRGSDVESGSDGPDLLLVDGPTVPAFGAGSATLRSAAEDTPANPFDVSVDTLSNGLVTVSFAADGTISVTDEETGHEVLDGPGNRLVLYRDHPRQWDAWDVEEDVYAVGEQLPEPESFVVESGPVRATVRQRRVFGDSELVQDVSLYRDSKRVEFTTRVEWQETEKLLKTHFPAAVSSTRATYDTHFGHLERETHDNTSWDQARFEEAGGQWVDVSSSRYGVAVLNDCKYGVHVDGTDLSLSLLRAPNYPDSDADRGTHEFTYALLPHTDDAVDAGVQHAADELNATTRAVPVSDPVSLSPIALEPTDVVVEALKRAEDDDDRIVLRLYESAGCGTDATVDFDFPVAAAAETNLIEDHVTDLVLDDGRIELSFDPFEIKTVAVELRT